MHAPSESAIAAAADRAEARAAGGEARRKGRGRLSSMDLLPEDGQEDITWAVGELNNRERAQADILFEMNDRLAKKGIAPISKSAFNRRSVKLAAFTNKLAEARYLFGHLAPTFTAEHVDQQTIVLGEFLKLLCFELSQNDPRAIGPKGAMELAKAHLAVIQGQAISAKRRAALEAKFKAEAGEAIEKVAKARGVSKEVTEDLRRELFGVPAQPEASDGT